MSHSYFQEANVRLLTGSRFATQLRNRGVFARARGVRGARTRRNHHHHHHHHHGQGAISSTVNLRRQEGINVFTVKGFSASEQPGTTFRSWPERLSRSRSCLVRRKAHMMKFKPNQTRTYDGEGFKKRAACLCFKNDREDEVLLVSSSRHPDQWIVPGGGMEPEEEPGGAAVREVYEEAGVRGTLGRLLGVFENQDSKHRTYVYVLTVTETLEYWEDSVNIGRKRKWFKVDEAIRVLQCHKPVHAEYLRKLSPCSSPTNGNSQGPGGLDDNASIRQTSSDCGLTRLHR